MRRFLRWLLSPALRRRVVVYAREPMDEATLKRVFREWGADEQKQAVLQMIQEAIDDQVGGVSARALSAEERAHAAGGLAALEELQASLIERCAIRGGVAQ